MHLTITVSGIQSVKLEDTIRVIGMDHSIVITALDGGTISNDPGTVTILSALVWYIIAVHEKLVSPINFEAVTI